MRDIAYEQREIQSAIAEERRVEAAPLAERKEGQTSYFDSIKNAPEVIAERVGWLLEGNYGHGWQLRALSATARMNRPALYSQMIAILDHQCPSRMAVDAWKKLTKAEQGKLQRLVEQVIEAHDAEMAQG